MELCVCHYVYMYKISSSLKIYSIGLWGLLIAVQLTVDLTISCNMKQALPRISKLSADFMLIQCIKIMSIFLGRDMSGMTFIGSKLVSFNQALVPYEISKVNFWCEENKFLVSMSEEI